MRNISGHGENKISGNKGGFTLLETLLVVAIVAVLLGLSIIGVIAIQKELRQRELDSKAEIIYMAAQNRLTELTASGRADLYTPNEKDSTETAAIAPLNLIPCDSTDSKRTDKDLYYVSSSVESIASVILPESRVEKELRDNNWVVEYDPASGSVYAVFYSEKDMEYTPNDFDKLRDKKQRKKAGAWIGYYGGDAVANIVTDDLDPKMEIYNEETLHAIISCNRMVEGNVTFTVKIKDSFGNEATEEIETAKLVAKGTRLTYDLVLDKMNKSGEKDNRFKEKYPDLVAGSDITVTVTAKSDSDLVDDKSVEGKTNSLFAEIRNSGNSSEDDNKDTAVITYCRHLQNLDEGSGINEEGKNKKKIDITKGVQENNLHFENDEDNVDDWYSLYGDNVYEAVTNDNLVSYTGKFTGEDGHSQNTVIYGLVTKTGLFGTFSGDSLTDVVLSGAKITGGTHAGALAGNIKPKTSVEISGCKVYLSKQEGDLEGKDETDKWITGNSETEYIGGLVGYTDGKVTIKESFAATVAGKAEAGTTGGLVGYATGTLTLQESYADCYLYGGQVGGLIGAAADSSTISIESCYSVGYIYASNTAAGFVAEKVGAMEDSYSACAYMPYEGENKYAKNIYAVSNGFTTVKDVYYLGDGNINKGKDNKLQGKTYDDMSERTEFVNYLDTNFTSETGGDNTSAYNLMNQGLTDYSFPRLAKLQHYGDWKADFESGKPVYYEDYEGGGCGVYGANLNTLEDTKIVLGDGYGIIYDSGNKPSGKITVKYGSNKDDTVELNADDAVKISAKGVGYYLLKFPKEVVNTTYASAGFYQEIEIDGVSYYYNPHFAKTVTTSKPNTVSDVYVRTARQLYSMSLYYQTYADKTAGSTYWQELDIDYGTYDWTNYYKSGEAVDTQSPIGVNGEKPFKATYTGMCNIIKGVSFVASENYYAGMFGYNKGKLQNIVIANDYDGTTNRFVKVTKNIEGSKAKARVGVLCGMNTRTITNCAVAGYTFNLKAYQSSELFAGGLVGGNSGTVKKCSSDCPVMQVSETYATMGVGGFTGRNTGHISECYSIGRVKIAEAKGDTVASAAGFAGENTGGLNTTYCAVAITISGNAKGYGFAPAGGTVTNSYYLNDGSYYYVGELSAYKIDAGDTRAQSTKATKLKDIAGNNNRRISNASNSLYHGKTTEEDIYQYPAVVTKNGEYVHYGNWPVETQLGDVGVFYWEYEEGGPNAGYHFRYLGIKGDDGIGGSSLCTAHDDGGIVTDYGYGYYYKEGSSAELTMTSFANKPTENTTVQEELSSQVTGYTFVAYTTGNSTGNLYLNKNVANGTWNLAYTKDSTTKTYEYTVCPFFANSFKLDSPALTKKVGYDGNENTPGTEGTEYDVRSAEQLQYINWNSDNLDATTVVSKAGDATTEWSRTERKYVTYYKDYNFTYLKYIDTDSSTGTGKFYWEQTHDMDSYDSETKTSSNFTPIGSMFYNGESNTNDAYCAFFAGSYVGNSYAIKNISIDTTSPMVGLFGVTIGAELRDIVMYSEYGNEIKISNASGDGNKWYCLGGLVGFAAEGSGGSNSAVMENCTVSGYTITDKRSKDGAWGGGSIGGLAGATNMDISKCTAVNDITIAYTYTGTYKNIRVGGLVGNCRATIDGCYAGGSIESTVTTQRTDGSYGNQKSAANSTSIWAGGIAGGIVMINYGNLGKGDFVGNVTGDVYVKNSYSYVNLPESGENQVRGSWSIASNGEMQDSSFAAIENSNIYIENCYAYEDNVKNTDDYKDKDNSHTTSTNYGTVLKKCTHTSRADSSASYSLDSYIYMKNDGNSPYVTYKQLSAASGETGSVIDLLNGGDSGKQFGFVTTEENGAKIDGKYSYPGDDPSLEGVNYPFPTVLTQEDTSGNTVNVHYGTWPKGSLYWADSMESFDMLDSDTITMYLNYESTDGSSTEPTFKFLDEDGNELTDDSPLSVKKCEFVTDKDYYEVVFDALKQGTVTVQAKVGDATANALISITGNLVITVSPAEIKTTVSKEETLTFTVKSANGKDLPGTTTWKVEVDDDAIASAVTSGNKVTVTGLKIGETSLTATATYTDNRGQTFTKSVVVVVTVEQADSTNNESDGTTE